MANVELSFLENTYNFELETVITETVHEPTFWIRVETTIFHPQSCGQPSDIGWINDIPISKVVYDKHHEINHCFESIQDFYKGQTVTLKIDKAYRLKNARLHTAGHLISLTMQSLYPQLKVITGHYFPGEATITLQGSNIPPHDLLHKQLTETLHKSIEERFPVFMEDEQQHPRYITIKSFPMVSCTGTPVRNLREIGQIELCRLKTDGNILKIGFRVVP